jgi:predicted permease
VAVLTLGTGIACTTTVFSWIDAVLLHPYPGAERGEELVTLEMVTAGAPNGGVSVSWRDYLDYREGMRGLAGLAAYRQTTFSVGEEEPRRVAWGELVSGNYFAVMGVRAKVGRVFTTEEDGSAAGAYPVAVISERLWKKMFDRDPEIAGRTLRVNRQVLTIAGVVGEEFRGTSPVMEYDLWIPMTMGAALGAMPETALQERGQRGGISSIGRLGRGVGIEQARAEAMGVARRLAEEYPSTNRRVSATVLEARDAHNGVNEYLRAPLGILQGVAFVVLLIVCANVANLLLARSVGRQREFGIRLALGAGRRRVARQVLLETLVLAAGGAGVGLVILLWTQGTLVTMVPNIGIPVRTATGWNERILGFTVLVCVAAGLISGAWPAMAAFRANLNEVLKESSRGDTVGVGGRRTRGALVMGEVALATVALAGAGLFLQSFENIRAIDPGFAAGKVTLGRFFMESAGGSGEETREIAERMEARLRAAAGVEAVSVTDFVPLSTTAGPYTRVRVEGYTPATGESTATNRALVGPGYFETMGIRVVEGREFTALDDRGREPVMIVNESFGRRYFAGRGVLGGRVFADGKLCRVVGIVRDSKYFSPAEGPSAHFYLPFRQFYNASPELYVLVRGPGAMAALREAAGETGGAAFHAVGLGEYIEVSTFGQKVAANLMGALGVLCLLLAGVGLYSVMAYTVNQRIPEIGIRMAMGARPADVIGMIVKEGMGLALAGVGVGLAGAMGAGRVVQNLLVGVSGWDAATLLGAGMFLALVALVATWIPAYRATRIDPMTALRK